MQDEEIPRGIVPLDQGGPAIVHFDGSCQPPGGGGVAGWGYLVQGARFHEEYGLATRPYSEHSTNNVAEYVGAIRALEWLAEQGFRGDVVLHGDSELVIRQMNGEYEVRAEHLKAYHARLKQLAQRFHEVRFEWVPREENQEADALSKRAIEEAGPEARAYRPRGGARIAEDDPPPAGS